MYLQILGIYKENRVCRLGEYKLKYAEHLGFRCEGLGYRRFYILELCTGLEEADISVQLDKHLLSLGKGKGLLN